MNYSVLLSASWTLLFQSHRGASYHHVGALHMLQCCIYQLNIFCWFGPSSQARSCLLAQTRETSGSVQGPDVESSWQTSLWGRVTKCVAEQSGCCGPVTPAGSAQCRKSISRTSNIVSFLRCLSSEDNGPIGERTSRWKMADADCPWIEKWNIATGRGNALIYNATFEKKIAFDILKELQIQSACVHRLSRYL